MASRNSNDRSFSDLKVIFGRRRSITATLPLFTVLITPSDDVLDVTDFGFRTRIDIYIQLEKKRSTIELAGHIGFISAGKDDSTDVRKIEELLGATSQLTIAADESQHFFTMLPEMRDYRVLVGECGPDIAGKVLLAMKDVVALKELYPASNIPAAAERTSVFQKSFVRTSESFFTYKNAGPILRGLEYEKVGMMSQDLLLTFRLAGRVNNHELRFHFDHNTELPKRIAVIIGKNGVGKSQALGNIVRAALKADTKILRDELTGDRILINRLLAFAPTNEAHSVFPKDRMKHPKVYYRRFALNRSRVIKSGIADLILQVVRSSNQIGNTSRWRIFLEALSALSHSEQLCVFTTSKQRSSVLLSDIENETSEHRLLDLYASIDTTKELARRVGEITYPLSSGEISFVRFAAQASLYVENGSLLLLDEPETHMHPNFISQFVSLLDRLLSKTGSAAIIATHSVYFVREVFRDQVTVLRATEENEILTEPIRLQTFGANVGAISDFVFGEDGPSRLASDLETSILRRFRSWSLLYERYKFELSPEMLGSLRLVLRARGEDE